MTKFLEGTITESNFRNQNKGYIIVITFFQKECQKITGVTFFKICYPPFLFKKNTLTWLLLVDLLFIVLLAVI